MRNIICDSGLFGHSRDCRVSGRSIEVALIREKYINVNGRVVVHGGVLRGANPSNNDNQHKGKRDTNRADDLQCGINAEQLLDSEEAVGSGRRATSSLHEEVRYVSGTGILRGVIDHGRSHQPSQEHS